MLNVWKKLKTLVFAGTLAVAAVHASGAEPEKIILITHGLASDPYWNIVKHGANDAAKQLGVTVDYRSPPTFDMVQMSNLINAAVNQRPAGIIVTIPDANALSGAIKNAVASGIPVISVDSGADVAAKLGTLLHIGQPEYPAGKAVGERLKELGLKKAICINHEVGNTALDDRCRGVKDGFGGNVTVLPTTADFQQVKSKVAAALAQDPSIDAVVALSAGQSGEPAVAAVQESNRTNVKVVSFDLSPGFLKDVGEGKALFAVEHQPYLFGYLGTVFLVNDIRSGLLPTNKVIETGPKFITKADAERVMSLSAKAIR
ncbi:sugar ABC transporter substrate-binding protein [Paraburkholderia sp. UYCP14C]|uniref:sugar ABC transporter substrate-binding protein n=1 Tax=Paraburkholderia sp. UYCP14C TaxID=2511130 RepID=UPI001020078A|nr:sugar ABC transporter substrate-binding protein [Paraburkholderia sp. UYCP14C]RZF25724.1 sugar ABC transporter substrate-binding protein [Paraburkholderia sp. UYCP14C]